jgi:hypothetical protein
MLAMRAAIEITVATAGRRCVEGDRARLRCRTEACRLSLGDPGCRLLRGNGDQRRSGRPNRAFGAGKSALYTSGSTAAQMGGEKLLCLDQSKRNPLEGFGGDVRFSHNVSVCRFRHDPPLPLVSNLRSFGTGS